MKKTKTKSKECIQCLFCNFEQKDPIVVKYFKEQKKKDRHSRYVCAACLDWIEYAAKPQKE